jgi:hypothetical protein
MFSHQLQLGGPWGELQATPEPSGTQQVFFINIFSGHLTGQETDIFLYFGGKFLNSEINYILIINIICIFIFKRQ